MLHYAPLLKQCGASQSIFQIVPSQDTNSMGLKSFESWTVARPRECNYATLIRLVILKIDFSFLFTTFNVPKKIINVFVDNLNLYYLIYI